MYDDRIKPSFLSPVPSNSPLLRLKVFQKIHQRVNKEKKRSQRGVAPPPAREFILNSNHNKTGGLNRTTMKTTDDSRQFDCPPKPTPL